MKRYINGFNPVEIKHTQNVKRRDLRGIQNFMSDYACDYGLVISNPLGSTKVLLELLEKSPHLLDYRLSA